MADGAQLSLTAVEFDFLWEAYGTAQLPYPLEVRSHGATMDERAALRAETMRDLAARGLVDGAGRPHPRLAGQLAVLGDAQTSLDSAHIDEPGAPAVRAIAAVLDDLGVLAVQYGDTLRIGEVAPDGLVGAIVGLLPRGTRGTERSLTMPVEQLVAGAGADFMQRKGVPETEGDRKALARLYAQERLRGGQIAANVRDVAGLRSRSPVLSWFDAESGRYLTKATSGADGREWITIAPVDVATLRQRIAELVGGIRAGSEVLR